MQRKPIEEVQSAEEARDLAVEWQHWQSEQDMSWDDVHAWEVYFEQLAAKFPELREEFQENAIIGRPDETGPQVEIVVKLTLSVPKSLVKGPIATDELQQFLNEKLHSEPDFYGEIDAGCIEIPPPQDIVASVVEELVEYYPCLASPYNVAQIRSKVIVVNTDNDLIDYKNVWDQVEKLAKEYDQ